jgi:hypothetical protein
MASSGRADGQSPAVANPFAITALAVKLPDRIEPSGTCRSCQLPPGERDPAAIAEDIADGYVTPGFAAAKYGYRG